MSSIDDEIKKAEAAHAKRIASLRAKAAKQEARIREVMLDLLAESDTEHFDRLREDAVARIEEQRQQRSASAKAATQRVTEPTPVSTDDDDDAFQEPHALRSA
ncbi:hypothetical protein [Janibacter terrae]|uniref:hypothetical protein n=1 Tax=Janibacter terrae TaxID=103817 RepID=UPI0031F75DE2